MRKKHASSIRDENFSSLDLPYSDRKNGGDLNPSPHPPHLLARRQERSCERRRHVLIGMPSWYHDPEERIQKGEGRSFFSGITPIFAAPGYLLVRWRNRLDDGGGGRSRDLCLSPITRRRIKDHLTPRRPAI
ncbi:hypothetical protein E2N92_12880 [Methanofollis formosanus]|uniref:Uncharacterized protein n=1 Tax=Methanofollis formosanus TaxID=299308 RepID=A0A8G1A4F2_9EURY|nr:hypothetical protein [Methanofollis formosanus]QYZ80261.1 hypothetical protein E2N92_12880 [Methanofollis formosanus]